MTNAHHDASEQASPPGAVFTRDGALELSCLYRQALVAGDISENERAGATTREERSAARRKQTDAEEAVMSWIWERVAYTGEDLDKIRDAMAARLRDADGPRADGPRADAAVTEVPHDHATDEAADICSICFPAPVRAEATP